MLSPILLRPPSLYDCDVIYKRAFLLITIFLSFQADSTNAYFDCKVLSRQHAMLIYEEGHFYLVDTGSSNGTFVNNIRLSKSGEESKMTEIFSNDILRLGSDIVDKVQRHDTECVTAEQNEMIISYQTHHKFIQVKPFKILDSCTNFC